VVIMIAAWRPASGVELPSGVRWAISGATLEASGRAIAIPMGYRVVHVAKAGPQLFVTAFTDSIGAGGNHLYHAEVWAFELTGDDLVTGGRRVLLAVDTQDGESKQLPTRTVPCQAACAVYVDGWENGHTLLFGSDGQAIEVAWPKRNGDQPCCVDFVTPLAWLEDHGAGYQTTLVCRVNYHGDDAPYLMTYHLQSGKIETMPFADGIERLGPELIAAIGRQIE
jgi:hypothetical protein